VSVPPGVFLRYAGT